MNRLIRMPRNSANGEREEASLIMMKRALSIWLSVGLMVLAMGIAMAATPPAGTIIRNQAAALVEDEVYYSNVIETVVLPVCAVSLTPDGSTTDPAQTVNVTPGGVAYLAYKIKNTGNDAFDFDLTSLQDPSSSWAPQSSAIYLDANRNAQIDPGEGQVQQVNLGAGESAWLILEVEAPNIGNGNLYISPSAGCPQGEVDNNNYSLVKLVNGPALQLEKKIFPVQARPGDAVSVELTVRNVGDAPTNGAVIITDDLVPLEDVDFEPGSAVAAKGSIKFNDGSSWVDNEPATTNGVRLVLPGLDIGENAILSFKVRLAVDAEQGDRENHAVAEGPGGPAEAVATLSVLPSYNLFLGPKDNPRALPGGEGSADDRQSADLIVDQTYCFAHTLENASSSADTFDLRANGLPEEVHGTFNITPTVPVSLPVFLDAGEKLDFLFCVTANEEVDPFTVDLVATSASSGQSNHTYDEVRRVLPAGELVLTKSVDPQGTVAAGTELTYTLHFKNGYPVDTTNIEVIDWLDDNLEYVSSSPAGVYDEARHRVRWQIDNVPANGEWQAELKVKVKKGTPDDTLIENQFTLQADQTPNTLESNTTKTPVWSSSILLQKEVSPEEVYLGDSLHYSLTVSNPGTSALSITITDTPEPHLSYVAGSATPAEPEQSGGQLIWKDIDLGPGETLTITYDMRVLAGAPSKIDNTAIAKGTSSSGAAIASSEVTASVRTAEKVFLAKRATIIGRVFLDANKDGLYDAGSDVPLAGARILLSNGQQVLTDAYGNYAFRDIDAGVWQILLDPDTAPFPPLPHPEAMGDGYRHRVAAWGLTNSDFPLAAPAGVIDAVRETSLFMGPLRLEKKVIPLEKGRYRVVLYLQSDQALPELLVRDPLPDGGEKKFNFAEFKGSKTITYELEGLPILTDPEVRWRYP